MPPSQTPPRPQPRKRQGAEKPYPPVVGMEENRGEQREDVRQRQPAHLDGTPNELSQATDGEGCEADDQQPPERSKDGLHAHSTGYRLHSRENP
jgi:hypothetical protein